MISPRRVLLLWDIDHTLIDNGGASKDNYRLAFRLLVGRDAVAQPVTEGRTDVGIMDALLVANDVSPADHPSRKRLDALARAGAENAQSLQLRGRALPGAARVMRHLAAEPAVIHSVLTGNIEQNALVKLSAFDLDRWIDFSTGAFGETHAERGRLVAVARAKASERYGFDPDSETTIVVGDTVRDVEAGLVGGAHVLGVASGASTVDDLIVAGAHEALPDLADTRAVIGAIGRLGRVRLSPPDHGPSL